MPEINVPVGRFTVDFFWREQRLIVETDGYRSHHGRQAFEDDRLRDLELGLLGYRVVRFTYRQVTAEPARVAEILRRFCADWRFLAGMRQEGAIRGQYDR